MTDRDFTGQKENRELGLLYYNARYYVPGLGRFASADTIVPNSTNPQSFNRYSYVLNSPLNFVDPSGHRPSGACEESDNCLLGIDRNLADLAEVQIQYNPPNDGSAMANLILHFYWQQWNSMTPEQQSSYGSKQTYIDATTAAQSYVNHNGGTPIKAWGALITSNYIMDAAFTSSTAAYAEFIRGGDSGFIAARSFPCSFSEDTVVMTDDGFVPISEVAIGELVLAYNEDTGEVGYFPVSAIWTHEDPIIVYLTIDGETIITTPNHPFYNAKEEWVNAESLKKGDEIYTAYMRLGTIEDIEFSTDSQVMYNFTVAVAHTYAVGEGQWLVHNDCYGDPNTINFSQRTVSPNVLDYTTDMLEGRWDWNRPGTEPLRVMDVDGQLVSYDNRRLMAAQNAGLDRVPIQVVQPGDLYPGGKFRTWGDAFNDRFYDTRNINNGGVVPPQGLSTQPMILIKN